MTTEVISWILAGLTPTALIAIGIWVGGVQSRVKHLEEDHAKLSKAADSIIELSTTLKHADIMDLRDRIIKMEVVIKQIASKLDIPYSN